MQTLTRTEIAKSQKQKHLIWLKSIGYKIDTMYGLYGLERQAHRLAEEWCDSDMDQSELRRREAKISEHVMQLFGGKLPRGFQINLDPRGYALKIDDHVMKEHDQEYQRQGWWPYTDWGGYGILAPEFK